MKKILSAASLSFSILACSSGPPPDLAPDPGLVARMRSIEVVPVGGAVCPGRKMEARYFAQMDDGTRIPFSTSYDEDDPPPLHVIMLGRSSAEASPQGNGAWRADDDPLVSAMNGFHLSAYLRADPNITGTAMVRPEYSCTRRAFSFSGQNGSRGQAGRNGPDVDVRIDVLSSPFVERLLVASVQVDTAPPFFLFFDADRISSADWLEIRTAGGRGGRGVGGEKGAKGATGRVGCPGGTGAPGGAGGVGGPGGTGGRGGRVTVYVPADEPFLAGMVDAQSPGGRGGRGGPGGAGGDGGDGGPGQSGQRRCTAGEAGPAGPAGSEGRSGREGRRGPSAEVVEMDPADVFGRFVPPALSDLIDYSAR